MAEAVKTINDLNELLTIYDNLDNDLVFTNGHIIIINSLTENLEINLQVWHDVALVRQNNSWEWAAAASDVELKKKIWSPPFDARFPNQNQTRNCWQNYVDYFRCQKIKGEDYAPCEYFKKVYTHLCPGFWVEQWDEQRENGTFPGKI